MKINVSTKENIRKNSNNLLAILKKAEGSATVRLFETSRILPAVDGAEKKLKKLRIPKKSWLGCRIYLEPEHPANSYQYSAEGTYAFIDRFATGWFVIDIARMRVEKISYGSGVTVELALSESAHQKLPSLYTL